MGNQKLRKREFKLTLTRSGWRRCARVFGEVKRQQVVDIGIIGALGQLGEHLKQIAVILFSVKNSNK